MTPPNQFVVGAITFAIYFRIFEKIPNDEHLTDAGTIF